MSVRAPDWKADGELPARLSRYIKLEALPWRPTAFPDVEVEVLREDKELVLIDDQYHARGSWSDSAAPRACRHRAD